jgi:hypothetical protein
MAKHDENNNNRAITKLAENYALSMYLSKFRLDLYYLIMEALEDDIYLEYIEIRQPFEDLDLPKIAIYIKKSRNDFLEFAEKIKTLT